MEQLRLGHGMTLKPEMRPWRSSVNCFKSGLKPHSTTVRDLYVEALEKDLGSKLSIKILFSLSVVGPLGHPGSFCC